MRSKLKYDKTEFLVDVTEEKGMFSTAIPYMELDARGKDLDEVLTELTQKVENQTGLKSSEMYFLLSQGKNRAYDSGGKPLTWCKPSGQAEAERLAEQIRASMESFQGFYVHGSLDTHDSFVVLSQAIHQLALAIKKLAVD